MPGCDSCHGRRYYVAFTIPGKTPLYDENGVQVGVARKREGIRFPCRCTEAPAPEPLHTTPRSHIEAEAIRWFVAQDNQPDSPLWREWAHVSDAILLYKTFRRSLANARMLMHDSAIRDTVALYRKLVIVEEPAFPSVIEEDAFPRFIEEDAF